MQKKIFFFDPRILIVIITFVLVFGVSTGAQAKPYFEGKVIKLVLPTSAGGGADILTRMIVTHLPRYISGKPNIVIRNMPAAGGLVGANYAYKAKGDGKTIMLATAKVIMNNLLRPKGTVHKLEEMHPVYAAPFGNIMYSRPELVPTPKDIMTAKGLIWGHSAATGGTSTVWIIAKANLGYKSQDILGYGGSGPSRLAFLGGETNVTGAGVDSYGPSFKPLIDKGEAIAVMQSGLLDADGNVVPDKAAPPGIPTVKELYEEIYGKSPSGMLWDVYKMILSTRSFDNITSLPPKTKPEYVDIFRKAFVDMSKDKEFLADADRLAKYATHRVGMDLVKAYNKSMNFDPKVVQYLKDYLTKHYKIVFE
jgi:tripartite-type tricarboxylate transporter receptor subunit TctC